MIALAKLLNSITTSKKLSINALKMLFIVMFITINFTYSQVSSYTFTQSLSSAYAPLTGTPNVAYASPWTDHTAGAAFQATIPFPFSFDNITGITQLYISPNGFITFGATQPLNNNYTPISNNTSYTGVVSALGIDLKSNGNDVVYDVVGVAPNRTFVIEWINAERVIAPGNFDFQIRLNESDKSIELSYGSCTPTGATGFVEVGLRGFNNVVIQGNVNNRQQGSATVWYNNTSYLQINTGKLLTDLNAYPDLGLKFKYTPALPCVTPAIQPTALVLGATSITDSSINGNSFIAPSTLPTNYLILRSTVNTPPSATQIVNRTFYQATNVLGAYTVINNPLTSNPLATTFTQTGLAFNTTYYYWIISYNDKCLGAPFYNLTNILTASATTCAKATVASLGSTNGNGFVANWVTIPTATNYAIDVATDAAFTTIIPGYNNLLTGLVTTLNVSGLLPLTTYYFRIRAIGPGVCLMNSNTISTTTTCGYYSIPYYQNVDAFAPGTLPTCFTKLDVNGDGGISQWQVQNINFSSASRSMHIGKNVTQPMNDWFFMPGLNLTAGVSYRLFFRYNTGNTGGFSENLKVQLGQSATIVGMTETLLDLPNINNDVFQIAIVDFIPASSSVYYIGFQGYSIANQSYIVIDDMSVTLSPNCFEPKDVSIDFVSNTNATVTWTAASPAPANGYQYYLSQSNTPPTLATIPTGSTGAGITTLNLSSLTPSTYYYIWIRGNCTTADKSIWTLEESFSTECSTPSITSTTPTTRCGFGTSTLSASSTIGSTINWFANATNLIPLATGDNFTTPIISSTTTYYIQAKSFGAIAKAAPINPTNEGGIIATQNFSGSVSFFVTSPTSLQSIDIFPMVSGQVGQIAIRNSSNVTLATFNITTSVSGGTIAQVVPFNYYLEIGSYNLNFTTVPAAGIKMNTDNAFYPYTCSVADIMGNSFDNTAFLGFYNWKFTTQCLSPRLPIVATVTTPPTLTLSSSSSTICETYATPVVTVSGYGAYNSLTWSPSTGVSGSFATGFTFSPTTTTNYVLTANQTSGSLCGNIVTHNVTVNPLPPVIMVVPSTATICENTILPLNGSSGATSAVPIFIENFNAPTNGWTITNASVGGDVNAGVWTLRPNNYNYIGNFGLNIVFQSSDNSQFYLANADAQSAIPGPFTSTTLTSPSFSLAGYTSANLAVNQYLRTNTYDFVKIEISIDNGTSWVTVKSYLNSQGTVGNFANDTMNLNAFLGNSNVKLRFNYFSPWAYYWALNNVAVTGTLAAALTWTPVTNLYSDASATIPYVAGTPVSVVYAKPIVNSTYTATITGSNSCFRTSSTTITVVPSTVAGTISGNQVLCSGIAPNSITLLGNTGSIIRWEYADNALFTLNLTSIANTTATLPALQMGSFTTIRYFRAVVKNGICNEVPTNGVSISYPSTSWNGSVWSNGIPDTTMKAIFNGNYSSTGNIFACSVLVNSGLVTINSNHNLVVDNEVVISGGALTFENNASLLQINNVANTGNITYKRDTTPMKKFDYTYWSTPVSPQTFIGLSALTPSDKYYRYDPTIAYWSNVPGNSLMDVGKGYIVRAPFNFNTSTPAIYNGSFYGIPNNGNYTTPVQVATSNYNLIGNPYPSALNIDLFLSDPVNTPLIDATIYLWTHNTPITLNQYTSNDYAVYNYLGGTGTASANNLGINNSIPLGKIASGQAFFTKALSSGNVIFKNSMRIIGNNTQFFKMNNSSNDSNFQDFEKHRIWLDIVNSTGSFKQTLLGYATNATLGGTDRGLDGAYLNAGNQVVLYSLADAISLSIQGRPLPFNDNDEVDLGFYTATTDTFQINLNTFDGLFENQNIFLKDKELNILHNLKQSSYNFSSIAGTFNTRFSIVYKDNTLGLDAYSNDNNTIVLYKPNENLNIKTTNLIMKSVKIFDTRGRLISDKKDINASETSINIGTINQVILVQITTNDNKIITRKYVN